MAKKAIITGVTGQDGAYLAKFLLEKGYSVYGTFRRLSTPNFWRLLYLGIFDKMFLIPADLIDSSSIYEAIEMCQPDEIYNLAAQSFVGASFEQPVASGTITGLGVARILEAVRQINPKIRFYQASTSELYGNGDAAQQTEDTHFKPASPYAAAKLYAHWITRMYRETHGIFACSGILFNHESPIRGLEFVTRKITNCAAKIALGLEKELRLGNLEAKRDWGYAPEYVQAMWLMMQQKKPDDFVIATDETHTVREFVEKTFARLGLAPDKYVTVDKTFFRPVDVNLLQGDYHKAKTVLNWQPQTKFDRLIEVMVDEDLSRWQRCLKGEVFPWDAPNYPSENVIITRMTSSRK
ncbi:MAG: GDP-mannose 4,6-dehydratase [Dehalococcoidia bacterium]|nr:GDP-mannose 4,6-dehydratase [Dehalococcoidia bacterium]MDD5493136.1 GDP-mannose 4,6-dehydratase [Dehalococcoidia bacterium]